MKSRFVIGCALIVVLLLVIGGYLFWRIKTPPHVAENFKELPSAEKQRRRRETQQLEQQVKDVVRSIKAGNKSSFRLEANAEQLNTLVQDRVRTEKFAIHDLRVGLDDNELTLQGIVPFKGMETTATLTGDVKAENGKLKYSVKKFLIGGLFEAPSKWKRKIEDSVEKNLNKLLTNENIHITRAAVEGKKLIIEGEPR